MMGKAALIALRVWEKDVNARDLRVEKGAYVPQRLVQALEKLIDVDNVFAILGNSARPTCRR